MIPVDAAVAAGLRKPEIWQTQEVPVLMRDALPGNVKDKPPSIALYVTVNAPVPEYCKLVHEIPACSSLRALEVPVNSTNVRPVKLSKVNGESGVNVTERVTF